MRWQWAGGAGRQTGRAAELGRRWAAGLLGSGVRRAVGVDLGAGSIKWVELVRRWGGGCSLAGLGRVEVPTGLMLDGPAEHLQAWMQLLQSLGLQRTVRTRAVAMALPASGVILRRTRFRAGLQADELAAYVEGEAAAWAPFPLESLALDFAVLGPAEGATGEVDVLMAAARQDRVQWRQTLAQAAGLKLTVIDTESNAAALALAHWRPPVQSGAPGLALALVDLGCNAVCLRVMMQSELLFERSEELAPQFAQAEHGQWPAHCLTIARCLQVFQAAQPGRGLLGLALAGEANGRPGLPDVLTRLTGLPAWWLDPFVNLLPCADAGPKPQAIQACAYVVACGLAWRALSP